MREPRESRSSRCHQVLLVIGFAVTVLTSMVFAAAPASAHTGFEASTPADGATVGEPVAQVTLTFTGPAEPSGAGFEVLDPQGVTREPTAEPNADRTEWTLTFDEPLAGGVVGVRWMVQAPDAHPIDGSFSFTVTAPSSEGATAAEDSLESFFTDGGSTTQLAERVAGIGRILGIGGTLLGVGAIVFATFVLRGSARDVRHVLFWVRRAGLIIVIGAMVRLIGRVVIDAGGDWTAVASPGAFWKVLLTSTGLAILLRLAGGVLLTAGCRIQLTSAPEHPDLVSRIHTLVSAGAPGEPGSPGEAHERAAPADDPGDDVAWEPRSGLVLWAGVAALLLGYLFDGHTVTEGSRAITAASDVVHVLAAAVWVGGVLMLASVLRRRHKAEEALRALYLAARFSVVAVLALVAVAASGLVLAWVVLDAPSELWSTPWGQLLIAKTALVGVAAGMGGYNHRVLIPQMDASPPDGPASERFRRVVSIEAVVLCAVIVVTAFLVGAAS